MVATSPYDGWPRATPATHRLHPPPGDCNQWYITGRRSTVSARETSWVEGGNSNWGCVGRPFPPHVLHSPWCWAPAFGSSCSSQPPSGRRAVAASLVAGVGKEFPPRPGKANRLTPAPHRQPGPILLGGWDTGKTKEILQSQTASLPRAKPSSPTPLGKACSSIPPFLTPLNIFAALMQTISE